MCVRISIIKICSFFRLAVTFESLRVWKNTERSVHFFYSVVLFTRLIQDQPGCFGCFGTKDKVTNTAPVCTFTDGEPPYEAAQKNVFCFYEVFFLWVPLL